MALNYTWAAADRFQQSIAGGRLNNQVTTLIGLAGYALDSQRDAALAELLAASTLGGALNRDLFIANGFGLVIGHTSQLSFASGTHEFQMLGTAAPDSTIGLGRWQDGTGSPTIRFYKSRHATIGSLAAVTTGDNLGSIQAFGDDGTDANTASSAIIFATEGTIGTGQVPGVIRFRVAAAGTLADALVIDSAKAAVFSGTVTFGADALVDTDSAWDLGATGERWRRLWVDEITVGGTIAGNIAQFSGTAYIGDTANAQVTLGLTINQGAADDDAFALKSSDVNHGMTDEAEADTYFSIRKQGAAVGGAELRGFTESGTIGIQILGAGNNESSTKSTSGTGTIHLISKVRSGSAIVDMGTDMNLVSISDGSATRFIFDKEGSGHADVEWVTYDRHNDLQVLEDLETHLAPNGVNRMFGDVIKHDRSFFEDEKLFHDIRDVGEGKMRGMMNYTKMIMLHSGAIRQVGGRQMMLENCLRGLVEANPTLEGRTEALALLEAV